MTARLTPERYLEVIEQEGERLLMTAEAALDQPVPTCPGWTVDDLVFHVGVVYSHKIAVLQQGTRPVEWELPPDDATPADDVAWGHARLHALVTELRARPATDRAWTFHAPDQSVGFWLRRMAHETVVHRADAEAALGPIAPIDEDVALDGIDEFVSVMLTSDGPAAAVSVTGASVEFSSLGVRVSGSASDLLLWLWGRVPDSAVVIGGSTAAAASLRGVLQGAGQ
jgi:uncharacterized protein (TIGR03083 family)